MPTPTFGRFCKNTETPDRPNVENKDRWLRDNGLSGQIPPSLGGLPNLQRVRIVGNDFTGCIPAGLLDGPAWYRDAQELGLPACASNGGP